MTVAIQHHQSGRLPQAEALYRQVLEMTPNHPDALHLLGVVELQNGNPDAGAELIHQAICHDQDNADYQANFGMALWELGRQDEAVSAYERALHLNPSHANAHYSLGNAHRARGRLAEAIASLRHSVRLELGAVEVRANLAALLLENDNAAAALEECDACLDRQPNSRLALSYKALALQSLGKRQPARYLLDLERLVIAQTIEIPAELGSLPEFNAALARHILVHPTLSEAQNRQSNPLWPTNGRVAGRAQGSVRRPGSDIELGGSRLSLLYPPGWRPPLSGGSSPSMEPGCVGGSVGLPGASNCPHACRWMGEWGVLR